VAGSQDQAHIITVIRPSIEAYQFLGPNPIWISDRTAVSGDTPNALETFLLNFNACQPAVKIFQWVPDSSSDSDFDPVLCWLFSLWAGIDALCGLLMRSQYDGCPGRLSVFVRQIKSAVFSFQYKHPKAVPDGIGNRFAVAADF